MGKGASASTQGTKTYRCRYRHIIAPGEWKCPYRHPIVLDEEPRIGYFDIETTGLKANIDIMLSWALKHRDGRVLSQPIGEISLAGEKKLIEGLLGAFKGVNTLVGYYSTGFDIPFLRSRCLELGLKFPLYGAMHHIDLYYAARNRLLLTNNRLVTVAGFLDIQGKTPIDVKIWRAAWMGDRKALGKVLEHNEGDVIALEGLHKYLEPFIRPVKRSV